jgi:hypothetical protein
VADQLRPDSLKWALTHILRFGDTDLFPVPFEYKAIEHSWDGLQGELVSLDLSTYEPRSLRRFLVPKPGGGFRVAIQLDPIDTLLYTAMIYEAAALIEQQRVSPERRIACAYRVEIDANGQFFRAQNGWPDYHEQSTLLAQSGKYNYVLTADIADFYNQISHHRVRNALELAGASPERARNVEQFLMNLAALQSRGIPVGPSASILLSEACLSDVDSFLLRKGYVHTRYSDDFRIFCTNRCEAHRALHDLSDYLYTAHRLTLQSSKTRPVPIAEFVETELLDPERLEEQGKTEKLNQLMNVLEEYIEAAYSSFGDGVSIEEIIDGLPEEQLRIARDNIVELFDACLQKTPLHLGLSRYLLRRASALQTGVLQERVLENLDTLAPVMRDTAKYLTKSMRASTAVTIGNGLIKFVTTSDLAFIPYLRLWIASIFLEKLTAEFGNVIYPLFEDIDDRLGVRPMALLACELKLLDWVRERKETWNNHSPWDRRSIVWAASVLPQDERGFWLKRVQGSGDILDRAVAKAILGGLRFTSGG